MKKTLISYVGICTVAILTAAATKAGGWLWDDVLEERATKLCNKFRKKKGIKFKIIECRKRAES